MIVGEWRRWRGREGGLRRFIDLIKCKYVTAVWFF